MRDSIGGGGATSSSGEKGQQEKTVLNKLVKEQKMEIDNLKNMLSLALNSDSKMGLKQNTNKSRSKGFL